MSDREASRGTICKCGSAKTYHRDIDKRDHEYEPRYPARRARSDLPDAPPPLDEMSKWLSDPQVITTLHKIVWTDVPEDVFAREMRILAGAVAEYAALAQQEADR